MLHTMKGWVSVQMYDSTMVRLALSDHLHRHCLIDSSGLEERPMFLRTNEAKSVSSLSFTLHRQSTHSIIIFTLNTCHTALLSASLPRERPTLAIICLLRVGLCSSRYGRTADFGTSGASSS